jgi:hypothetical protein
MNDNSTSFIDYWNTALRAGCWFCLLGISSEATQKHLLWATDRVFVPFRFMHLRRRHQRGFWAIPSRIH